METKTETYQRIKKQWLASLNSELPTSIHQLNLCALLKKELGFFWVGFYNRHEEKSLILGPYQGEVPCFTISYGRGLCGEAAEQCVSRTVNDVHNYENYIACHPEPQSEMVVPGVKDGKCLFVLDLDSTKKSGFDEVDQRFLEDFCEIIVQKFYSK